MTKEAMQAAVTERWQALREALEGEDAARIRALALEVHGMTHPAAVSGLEGRTIADCVLDQLPERQNAPVSRQVWDTDLRYAGTATVPLIWQLWHTARIEDLVSNLLMANRPQIFNADWQRRLGAAITDTGNALTEAEAFAFGRSLNPEALREYMIAVGRSSREIIAGLTLEELRSMPPEEQVLRIYEEGGVTADARSVWLLIFWGRLTRAGMLLTPLTSHHMMHLPTCLEEPILM